MRFILVLLLTLAFAFSASAQSSDKYLKVEQVVISGKAFRMLNNSSRVQEIGGDSVSMSNSNRFRDAKTTRQIQPTESQLEDRQHNNLDFERGAKADNNQHFSILFSNLSQKGIKSVTFKIILTQYGKKYFARSFKGKPLPAKNEKFYISERFFSTKNLSAPNTEKEVIVENVEFTDGTKLKF